MARRILRVGNQGPVTIPAEIRSALGIKPGARISSGLESTRIVLEVVSEELVDKTRGMFKGGPSLCDALKRQRQTDNW